jgi:hypothetical protein
VLRFRIVIAAFAISLAGPSSAQQRTETRFYGSDFSLRIERLEHRIERVSQSDRVSGSEMVALRREIRGLRELHHNLSRGGLTPTERKELDGRLGYIQDRIRFAVRNGDFRGRYHDWYGDDLCDDDIDDHHDWDDRRRYRRERRDDAAEDQDLPERNGDRPRRDRREFDRNPDGCR